MHCSAAAAIKCEYEKFRVYRSGNINIYIIIIHFIGCLRILYYHTVVYILLL